MKKVELSWYFGKCDPIAKDRTRCKVSLPHKVYMCDDAVETFFTAICSTVWIFGWYATVQLMYNFRLSEER